MTFRPFRSLLPLLAALGLSAPAAAVPFSTLTYNVAGLLEPFSSGNPAANTPLISCLIRDYTLVNVQEDFNYHAALYDTCDDHPYRSATSGGMGIGDGLNTLSRYTYQDWVRVDWDACNGVDCLTPKGFTHARVRLAEGVYVSLINLHAQAQTETADLTARRSNMLQLLAWIEANTPGDAVIVMGDTNTRYTREGDNVREFLKHGFTDVWLDRIRGGAVPPVGDALTDCAATTTSPSCEIVDKVFFRNNGHVSLSALQYLVDRARFVDAAGNDLSDHWPIAVDWDWTTDPDLRLSDNIGGPHGTAFNDVALLPAQSSVSRLVIRAGSRVDRVETVLSSGYVLSHGGSGGTEKSLTLAAGEYLRTLYVCSGQKDGRTRIFHVKFTTSTGRTLAGGSTTSSCATYTAPDGFAIAGFHGRSGDEVDRLGVVYARRPATTPPAAGWVQFVNKQSGLCLDISNATMANGTNVLQWTCNGGNWQKWHYDPQTGLIRSKHDPRYCLDNDGSYADGANIKIWSCTGNANQRFSIDYATGAVRMQTNPQQVLDGVGTAAGGEVVTWGDWNGVNQRWNFVP